MLNAEIKHNALLSENVNEENNIKNLRDTEVKCMYEKLLTNNKIIVLDHPINPMNCFVVLEKQSLKKGRKICMLLNFYQRNNQRVLKSF